MKLVSMVCPHCGGKTELSANTKQAVCPFCGANFAIDDEVRYVRFDNSEQSGYDFEQGRMRAQQEAMDARIAAEQARIQAQQDAERKRNRFVWWVIGWIFFFPIPLTVLIARSDKLKTVWKAVLIIALWGIILMGALSNRNSNQRKRDEYVDKPRVDSFIADIEPEKPSDPENITKKLMSFGFEYWEADVIHYAFLMCGLTNIDNAEPTNANATIDGLAVYRVVPNKKQTVVFTIKNRKLFYIEVNGVAIYDEDSGGFIKGKYDTVIVRKSVSDSERERLCKLTQFILDNYCIEAFEYDKWVVNRSNDEYMVQCEVYALSKRGSKNWVTAKVWYTDKGSRFEETAVKVNGIRYK